MVTLMETITRRFRKGRGILVSVAGQRTLDNVSFGSEPAVDEKLTIFDSPIDNNRLDGRWLNTVTRRPIIREAMPW